jgi:hypothetical protein
MPLLISSIECHFLLDTFVNLLLFKIHPHVKFTIPFFLVYCFGIIRLHASGDICLTPFAVPTCTFGNISFEFCTLSQKKWFSLYKTKPCTINVLNLWSISNYIIIRITRCQIMDCKSRVLKAEKLRQIQGCSLFSRSHLTECIGCHILVIITSWWSLPEDCHVMLSRKSHNINLPPQILMSCNSNSVAFSQWAEIVWILHNNLCW